MITTAKIAGSFVLSDDGGHSFTIATTREPEGGWRGTIELRSQLMKNEEAAIKHLTRTARTFVQLSEEADAPPARVGRTHPADVNMALSQALSNCQGLINDALARGDNGGAEAWKAAFDAIEAAENVMRDARKVQRW